MAAFEDSARRELANVTPSLSVLPAQEFVHEVRALCERWGMHQLLKELSRAYVHVLSSSRAPLRSSVAQTCSALTPRYIAFVLLLLHDIRALEQGVGSLDVLSCVL